MRDAHPTDIAAQSAAAVITILTVAGAHDDDLARIAAALRAQTLLGWRWRILSERDLDAAAIGLDDPRITVGAAQEISGLDIHAALHDAPGHYLAMLDPQAWPLPTFLEKAVWLLATTPQAACCSAHASDGSTTWIYGFEQGERFLQRSYIPGALVLRRDAYAQTTGLDGETPRSHVIWDLALRLAAHGHAGMIIPETLIQIESLDALGLSEAAAAQIPDALRADMLRRYGGLAGRFPVATRAEQRPYEMVDDRQPIDNLLPKPPGTQRLLLLMPWLIVGGAERVNLNMLEHLTTHGYEVTIATTLLRVQHNWVSAFAQHTSDIFLLDHFLRSPDFARFLVYLIRSRQIDIVMVSNSYYGYQLLPYLRSQCPEIVVVDYCHSGDDLWRNGGYPRCGAAYQALINLNIASSQNVKQWMVDRGAAPETIDIAYTNVDVDYWSPSVEARRRVRESLGMRDDQTLIMFVGRLAGEKRPLMLARILGQLRDRRPGSFRCVIVGDGAERPALEQEIAARQLQDQLLLLGRIADEAIRDHLSAADVLLLPSETEGISVAIFEAMAMEVIPVSALVGGQAELVVPECGYLIARTPGELDAYVAALTEIVDDPVRRRQMQAAARERVVRHFPLSAFGGHMAELFARARQLQRERPLTPVSPGLGREHAAQALELMRVERALDELWADRERLRGQQAPAPSTPRGALKQLLKLTLGPAYRWAIAHNMGWVAVLRQRVGALLRRG